VRFFSRWRRIADTLGRMAIIGKRNTLSIVRASTPGLYLDGGELGEILLPGRYIPADLKPKDKLDVFIYRDSEDRLVATTETPLAMVGEFAYLKVISVNRSIGAFLDWGWPRICCCHSANRNRRSCRRLGDCPCLSGREDKSDCCDHAVEPAAQPGYAGLSRWTSGQPPHHRRTPLGYNAIVENAHRGLLYHDNLAAPLLAGQKLKGFVRTVRPSGKIDLSLDASGYKRVAPLRDQIVHALQRNGGRLAFDDDSRPKRFGRNLASAKRPSSKLWATSTRSAESAFRTPELSCSTNPLGLHAVDGGHRS